MAGCNYSAFAAPGDVKTDDALHMRLDLPGFHTISEAVRNKLLKDINIQPVGDFDEDVGYGIQGKFSGISYSISFKDFHILPTAGALVAEADISRIEVHINRAEFSKNVGLTIRTTCTNTVMTAGNRSSLHLRMGLAPAVVQGRIALNATDVSFDLPEDAYEVSGPDECTGSLGIGRVFSFAVHHTLSRSRDAIAKKVEGRVRGMIPTFADDLNRILTTKMPLKLGGSPALPLQNILLSAKPFAMEITQNAAEFSLSIQVTPAPMTLLDEDDDTVQGHDTFVETGEIIAGTLGLRTGVLNDFLAHSIPQLPASIPVDPTQAPGVGELFTRQGLSALLPDLNQAVLDDDRVYANIGFAQAPFLTSDQKSDGHVTLVLHMPDVLVGLRIKQKGLLTPYFNLSFNASIPVQATLSGQYLKLNVVPPGQISVRGNWAEGYVPKVDIYEHDVADTLFKSVLDILYGAGTISRISIPTIDIDTQTKLLITHPRVNNGFVMIDLKKQ